MSESLKRKRTANFNAEEKIKFVRLLQEMGSVIVDKSTAHMISNKTKEEAWQKIADALNAGGSYTRRTPESLKKLWQKLKSECKTFKGKAKYNLGTGGIKSVQY